MADEELKQYPRGQAGLGKGDLQQITDFKWDYTNNAKLVHVLRVVDGPSGFTTGNRAVSFDFNCVVDEDGPERDYFDLVTSGKPQRVCIKLPGAVTKQINGVIVKVGGELTLEDGVKMSVSGVGKFVKN